MQIITKPADEEEDVSEYTIISYTVLHIVYPVYVLHYSILYNVCMYVQFKFPRPPAGAPMTAGPQSSSAGATSAPSGAPIATNKAR